MAWFNYKGKIREVSTKWEKTAPVASPQHDLLESLYAWERRLRGYDLYGAPVELEPTFEPFDAQREAWEWQRIPQPPTGTSASDLIHLGLLLPLEQAVTLAHMTQWLASLRSLALPLALEIVADARAIRYQVTCARSEAPTVVAALQAQFPQARLEGVGKNETSDALVQSLRPLLDGVLDYRIVDFGLGEAVYRPLAILENLNPNPHLSLVSALGALEEGEVAGMQLLLAPAHGAWTKALSGFAAHFDRDAKAHSGSSESEIERCLRLKLSSPLWAVCLRVFSFTGRGPRANLGDRALGRCQQIVAALAFDETVSSHRGLESNELLALDDGGLDPNEHLRDVLSRRSRRSGMLLSQDELVGLWHPPAPSLQHLRLLRYDPRRRELPEHLRDAPGAALGVLDTGGSAPTSYEEPTFVPWPDAYRNRHAYLLGATRMGKSTLLSNLIAQDLLAGRGLCLIDPHGDLAHDVLRAIPPHREQDVLFLDLSDTAFPVSLGLLETADEWEKRLLVSDLLSILHRLFAASWGDRLEHILRHALLTLLADEGEPHTLRDIRPLLSDPAYREHLLPRLTDPDLQSFWNSEFSGYSASAFAPVFNKLGLLLSSPLVRNIVAGESDVENGLAPKPKLNPAALIQDRRILIVNLAQSLIGEDNAHFLGALLVSKIQLAAMHGLRRGASERVPFTLYVDEFQNFVVSSFAKILSEAGKAGLSLVMANQFLEQLNEGLQTAILSNVGALVSFRVSAASGRRLQGEFGGLYSADHLTDLERGQAIARLGKAGDSFALRTFPPLRPEEMDADPNAPERIIEATRREICRPRAQVEAGLRESEARLEAIRADWQERQDMKKRETRDDLKKEKTEKEATTKGGSQKPDNKRSDNRKQRDEGIEDVSVEPVGRTGPARDISVEHSPPSRETVKKVVAKKVVVAKAEKEAAARVETDGFGAGDIEPENLEIEHLGDDNVETLKPATKKVSPASGKPKTQERKKPSSSRKPATAKAAKSTTAQIPTEAASQEALPLKPASVSAQESTEALPQLNAQFRGNEKKAPEMVTSPIESLSVQSPSVGSPSAESSLANSLLANPPSVNPPSTELSTSTDDLESTVPGVESERPETAAIPLFFGLPDSDFAPDQKVEAEEAKAEQTEKEEPFEGNGAPHMGVEEEDAKSDIQGGEMA